MNPTRSYLDHYLSDLHDLISDPAMVEIAINPDGKVWALRRGELFMSPCDVQTAPDLCEKLTRQIAGNSSETVSKEAPLAGGSAIYGGRALRAQCVLKPATVDGGTVSFRLFSALPLDKIKLQFLHGKPVSSADLRRNRNTRLRELIEAGDLETVLKTCVTEKMNMLISGGTETGKTVAMRKIISFIDPRERLITIEDTRELFPEQPNAVALMASRKHPERSANVLLEATLRMRPDRIIVGEIRGEEAMTFLEAINTGHGGSMTTLHAETPELAVDRLAIMAGRAKVPMTYQDLRRYILNSIDVIIQCGRTDGSRGISEIYIPQLDEKVTT